MKLVKLLLKMITFLLYKKGDHIFSQIVKMIRFIIKQIFNIKFCSRIDFLKKQN
jgi:hypothetical protein